MTPLITSTDISDDQFSDRFISYRKLIDDSVQLAKKIQDDMEQFGDVVPTYIMGVSRRGMIPATVIALHLDLPMGCVSYSSPKGVGQGAPSARWVMDKQTSMMNDDFVLIVDDVVQTGNTINDLVDVFSEKVSVATATLYCSDTVDITPTWYVERFSGYVRHHFMEDTSDVSIEMKKIEIDLEESIR